MSVRALQQRCPQTKAMLQANEPLTEQLNMWWKSFHSTRHKKKVVPEGASFSTRMGVTGRLVVLVLLPVFVLGAMSAPQAMHARGDAQRAAAGDRQVPSVTAMLAALDAVAVEQGEAQALNYVEQTDVPIAIVDQVLGQNVAAGWHAAERATARVLARLSPSLQRLLATSLRAARQPLDSGYATSNLSIVGPYQQAELLLQASGAAALASVQQRMLLTSGSGDVDRSLTALGWCYQMVLAAAAQARDDTAAFFGTPASRRAAQMRLAQDAALLAEAGQQLARSGVPAVARAWAKFVDSPSTTQYDLLLTDAQNGLDLPFVNGKLQLAAGNIALPAMSAAFRAIPLHWRLISAVVGQASATLRHAAGALAATNQDDYTFWLALMVIGLTGALALAFAVAQSISRPLRRLAEAARAVVAGSPVTRPLPKSGPRETAVVAHAFNALMDNLHLLEAKSQALASCDFDNPVLSAPLPGRLGESLQDSVRVLADSIQDRHQLQERLAYEATHDGLTDLVNRAAAISSLEHALLRARRRSDITAVIYLDLDNFKQANDLHSHQTGDYILRHVADRLSKASRAGDVVARIGGDEFVVIAERLERVDEAEPIAGRLVSALSNSVEWEGVRINVGASAGIALAHGGDATALDLLGHADLALYQAKQKGGGAVGVYDEALQQSLAHREEVERDLRAELARGGGGLVLHYQPLVGVDGDVKGLEALLRWDRFGEGLLLPDRFIPVAEASDLVVEIDRWVIAAVARQVAAWAASPELQTLPVAINVSGRHLMNHGLGPFIEKVISRTGVDPEALVIEVTETVLLDDLEVVAQELGAVRALGCQIAVDDFGTGYTSLAHIRRLPIDTIKIDRTFISEVHNAKGSSLVRMMMTLARELGLRTVSEGVETVQQLKTLEDLGADILQGWLVAAPMPPDEVASWVREQREEGRWLAAQTLGLHVPLL